MTLALVPALLWRRDHPLWMVVVAFAGCSLAELMAGADLDQNTLAFILLLPYALYRWGSGREAVIDTAMIAASMHITLSTVKTHVTSLMLKLGVRNRVEIAIWAYETGRVRVGSG